MSDSRSARIRAQLDHPIIDADGHLLEFLPLYLDAVRRVGGAAFFDEYRKRYETGHATGDWSQWGAWTPEQRRDVRLRRSAWWGTPTRNTLDAATSALPGLLRERMDELGIDFCISYGGLTLYVPIELDEDTRRISVRALNTSQAELYADQSDRILPVAAIPMFTPDEALEELDYAVEVLGHKAIMIPTGVPRPIPSIQRELPGAFPDAASWMDHFGLDSEYDYDPFWARCQELRVAVTAHSGILPHIPWYGRSISNFSFNHLCNHAYHQGLLCKSLYMGGVSRRFPALNFAFLEGGVAWAVQMLAEIRGTWEKRNLDALEDVRPTNLDRELYLELFRKHAGKWADGRLDFVEASLPAHDGVPQHERDDWAALDVSEAAELAPLFADRFFFGCEADDPCTPWAFSERTNPLGARLKAMLGSDIGHYDVPDMRKVVEEAWEPLENGLIEPADFRDLVFGNAVRLHGGMNPDFFSGTAVEADAIALLAEPATGSSAGS